jgi:hypothetical protein
MWLESMGVVLNSYTGDENMSCINTSFNFVLYWYLANVVVGHLSGMSNDNSTLQFVYVRLFSTLLCRALFPQISWCF